MPIDFFTYVIIQQYNEKFSPIIIFDCPCYEKAYDDIATKVLAARKSYLCCVLLPSLKKSQYVNHPSLVINHLTLPVMIGSDIDIHIRSGPNVAPSTRAHYEDHYMYGAFIIDGFVRIIQNFITNNLRNGHVYSLMDRKKDGKAIRIYCHEFYLKKRPPQTIISPLPSDVQKDGSYNSYDTIVLKFTKDLPAPPKAARLNRNQSMLQVEPTVPTLVTGSSKNSIDEIVERFDDYYVLISVKQEVLDKRMKNYEECVAKQLRAREHIVHELNTVGWFNVLMRNSKLANFKTHHTITKADCIDYFKTARRYGPQLDRLSNKTILTSTEILSRVICFSIEAGEDRLKNIRSYFVSGNIYWVLSTRRTRKIKTQFQCIYQMVDGQKLHLINNLAAVVRRHVSTIVRNSAALLFPKDGEDYVCPVNTKELVNAGETIALSLFVISSPPVPDKDVMKSFETLKRNISREEWQSGKYYRIAWESFLTNYYIENNITDLINFKRTNTFLVLRKYGGYINVMSEGHMVVKYSLKYQIFISPCERENFFNDAFTDCPLHMKFSSSVLRLPRSFNRTQIVKSVVSVQNIKGSSHIIRTPFDAINFKYAIGTSNAALVDITDEPVLTGDFFTKSYKFRPVDPYQYRRVMRKLQPGETVPDIIKKLYEIYKPVSLDDEFGLSLSDLIPDFNKHYEIIQKYLPHKIPIINAAIRKDNDDRFHPKFLNWKYSYYYNRLNQRDLKERVEHDFALSLTIRHAIAPHNLLKLGETEPYQNQLILYCGFGDVCGATNEDGVIIDKDLVENSNLRKLQSVTLNVSFASINGMSNKTMTKHRNETTYKKINKIYRSPNSNVIVFGILKTPHDLKIRLSSKNIRILKSEMPLTYRYTIYAEEYSNLDKLISSFYQPDTCTVTINMAYYVPFGVGCKVANLHGQKGIVSLVADLSQYKYYCADGTVVHPQILFSAVSILGRMTSSQLYEMMTSSKVAFNERGEFIAPIAFNIHHIDSGLKCNMSNSKNDLMTAENGFLTNNLAYAAYALEKQNPQNDIAKSLHLISELYKIEGVSFDTPQREEGLNPLGND